MGLHLKGASKSGRIFSPNKNDHTYVNFKAIWLKFFIKVDETLIKICYFVKSPSKNTYFVYADWERERERKKERKRNMQKRIDTERDIKRDLDIDIPKSLRYLR